MDALVQAVLELAGWGDLYAGDRRSQLSDAVKGDCHHLLGIRSDLCIFRLCQGVTSG